MPEEVSSGAKGIMDQAPTSILVGKRVVIAEDEGITQLQLSRTLRRYGMVVVGLADDGQAATEVVLREKPDLVLMDINLPVLDGLRATEAILSQLRVCIVLVTAFSEEAFYQKALELGACGYVIKPITSDTLLPHIQAALESFYPT